MRTKSFLKRPAVWLIALFTTLALAIPGGLARADAPLVPDSVLNAQIIERLKEDGHLPEGATAETHQLTQEEIGKLENLTIMGTEKVKSLEGLQYATSLKSLQVGGQEISDLSPITGLPKLIDITLASNPVTSFEPLASLPELRYLTVHNVKVDGLDTRLAPIAKLTKLTNFAGGNMGLKNADVVELGKLTTLDSVYLSENFISDFSPLKNSKLTLLWANDQTIDAGKFVGGTAEDVVTLPPFIDHLGNPVSKHPKVEYFQCNDEDADISTVASIGVSAEGVVTATIKPTDGYETNPVNKPQCILLYGYEESEATSTDVAFDISGQFSVVFASELTVTFKPENGEAEFTKTVLSGDPVAQPDDPVQEGFVFQGWFYGNDKWDFTTPVKSDMTLTAKWEKAEEPEQPGSVVPTTPGGDNGGSDDSVKPDPEKPAPSVPGTPGKPGKPAKPGKLPGTGV